MTGSHRRYKKLSLEERIINHLLLNSGATFDIGLMHGKMGHAILFYHCGIHFKNKVFTEFADELIDDLINHLHVEMNIGFENGLCGIGWGIDYLIGNNFVEGESYCICEELDERIMRTDPRRIMDYTLEKGITGLLHYILIHIKTCTQQGNNHPFDKIYFDDLYQAVNAIPKKEKELDMLISMYNTYYTEKTIPSYVADISLIFEKANVDDNITNLPLGLQKGISGTLLSSILE